MSSQFQYEGFIEMQRADNVPAGEITTIRSWVAHSFRSWRKQWRIRKENVDK